METMAPGAATPIHRHDCDEIWLIVSGHATAAIQDKVGGGRWQSVAPGGGRWRPVVPG